MIIEDGTGKKDADSYASTSDADDYLDNLYGATEWANILDDDKERLLKTATRIIDKMPIKYEKTVATQALKYPCHNLDDLSGAVGNGLKQAKEACILQAFFLLGSNDAINEALNQSIQGVRSEGLSSMSKSVAGFNSMRKYHPDVLNILAKFVDYCFSFRRY